MKTRQLFKVALVLWVLLLLACSQQEAFILETEAVNLEKLSNVTILDSNKSEDTEITTNYIKTKWEGLMKKEEGIHVSLESFRIIKTNKADNEDDLYFLIATSKDKTIETGAFLERISDNVYRLGVKECSCSGCPNGCNLIVEGQNCRCSDCDEDSNKKCTKTERVIING